MVCGGVRVLALLLLLLGQTELGCRAKWSHVMQSFDEAVQECADLLCISPSKLTSLRFGVLHEDAETKCLLRCVGVSSRFWSDHGGLRKDILARYFLADAADTQFVNRTETCLNGLSVLRTNDTQGCCELAFESFLCFYFNYGNLLRDRIFVPLDHLQLLHVTARCMEVHQITVDGLMSLSADELDGNANVHCLVRCIGIQTGVYSDRYGVNIDLVYAQYGEGYNEATYKSEALECIRRHNAETCDGERNPCKRAYHLLYKCFENVRNVITEYELHDSEEN